MPNELKPCPHCKSKNLTKAHILTARLPFWWYIECEECHWCGKTKMFLHRARRAWNRRADNA